MRPVTCAACVRVCARVHVLHMYGRAAGERRIRSHAQRVLVRVRVRVRVRVLVPVRRKYDVYVKAIHVDAANHTYVCVGSTPAGQVYDGKYEIKSNTSMLVVYARTHVFLCVCA